MMEAVVALAVFALVLPQYRQALHTQSLLVLVVEPLLEVAQKAIQTEATPYFQQYQQLEVVLVGAAVEVCLVVLAVVAVIQQAPAVLVTQAVIRP